MSTPVVFTTDQFDFGPVVLNSTGPDISVDPSFEPLRLAPPVWWPSSLYVDRS
jgi:hypothetical protein